MSTDDWEKPRSKGQHLTDSEIGQLKAAFKAGRTSRDIARELQCSSRIASKYYGYFEAEGAKREPSPRTTPSLPNRHYRSSFDL